MRFFFFASQIAKTPFPAAQALISDIKIKTSKMFTDFINRILGAEQKPSPNRLDNNIAEPSVIVRKDSNKTFPKPIPEKYKKDVEALRGKYGDAFETGLCISITLQDALSIMPRERRRIDAYRGLLSFLKEKLGIILSITSQKTKKL